MEEYKSKVAKPRHYADSEASAAGFCAGCDVDLHPGVNGKEEVGLIR